MSTFPGAASFVSSSNNTSGRLVRPFVLGTVHITGNAQLPSPDAEASLTTRYGWGASATFFVGRDGRVVQRLHPEWQTPWTNGSYNNPNWGLWSIAQAIRNGYGANDAVFITIENVGYPDWAALTGVQIEANARIFAWGSRLSGIAVDRGRIWGHRDVNSVDRWCCPTCGNLDYTIGLIVSRANQLLAPTPTPTPTPTPAPAPAPGTYQVGGLPVLFKALSGKCYIYAGKPVRDRASWSTGQVWATTTRNEPFRVWGMVAGELVPGAVNTQWYFGGYYAQGGWRVAYTPVIDTFGYTAD